MGKAILALILTAILLLSAYMTVKSYHVGYVNGCKQGISDMGVALGLRLVHPEALNVVCEQEYQHEANITSTISN